MSRGSAGSWLVRQLAPLVSLCRLVSASSALVALGPFLSALVTRTGWCSARPAARAAGLAPPWSPLVSACRSRSILERSCHADRLVLGSSGSSRHWSRSALASAVCACRTTQSPGGSSVGLAPRWSPPLTSSVAAQSPARANSTGIRLLSSVPHSWSSSFDCPASQVKKNQAHLLRREPLSWFCVSDLLLLERRELATRCNPR